LFTGQTLLFWAIGLEKALNKDQIAKKFTQTHTMNIKSTASLPSCVPLTRAAWIGNGDLWPRASIVNTITWTPKQNAEYQEAYDVQKYAIVRALLAEPPAAKEMRMGWIGACAPNPADDFFDKCWSMKEIEKTIKKGLIYGLENGRDRKEEMLTETKLELAVLSKQHAALLEKFYADDPAHLDRKRLRVFTRNDNSGSDAKTNDAEMHITLLGKRPLSEDDTMDKVSNRLQAVVPGETSEYWLTLNRMRKAVEILSWDKDHDDADVQQEVV